MIDLIKQFEDAPEVYPALPTGLSTAAAALDADMIWARIEAYTAHRFTERPVTWLLLGGGDWDPPLTPVNIDQAYEWNGSSWQTFEPGFGPIGFILPEGMTKIDATAGVNDSDVPAAVSEAFRRLAEYLADDPGTAGASSTAVAIGPIREELNRNPNWVARAMQHSGAGDLLRPYRRA